MKKIFMILILATSFLYGQSDNISAVATDYYPCSFTGTIDTADVILTVPSEFIQLDLISTSQDTVLVYTKGRNGAWTPSAVKDVSADTVMMYSASQIVVTTTEKKFTILDPEVFAIRLIVPNTPALTAKIFGIRAYK